MLKKIVSVVMLVQLLIGMSSLAFNIKPVTASGTIYIRADGSIDPPTATIQLDYSVSSVSPPVEWNKTYGGASRDYALSVVETSDGGYALVGPTYSFGAGDYDFWLIKIDSSGNMKWSKTYGEAGRTDEAKSCLQTSDGGYAIMGLASRLTTTPTGTYSSYDFWLIKTDSNGNMQWNKIYGRLNKWFDPWEPGDIIVPADDYAESLVQTSDGGYALLGWTLYKDDYRDDLDFWLVKTDAAGNMQWSKMYGGYDDESGYSLIQTSEGGYALTGSTESFGAGHPGDFWLVKTDSYGNTQWSKTYGGTGFEEAYSMVQTSDGGYALTGYPNSWLVKTDSYGNTQWSKTYGGPLGQSKACSLVQTSDGGYALLGSTLVLDRSTITDDWDFWLVKTDASGNTQWNTTYGGKGYWEDTGYSLIQTSDGGYALAGEVNLKWEEPYPPNEEDFWLIKLAGPKQDVAITNVMSSKTVVGQGYSLNINVTAANQGDYTETFNVAAYANATLIETANTTGLVGYWKFDENSGTTACDSSGCNNNGTIYGASWTTGRTNGALEFYCAAGDYVYVPPSEGLDIVKELTLEAWVKLDQAPPGNAIMVFKTPDTSGYNYMQYGMDIGGVVGGYERRIAFYVFTEYWHVVISNQALDVGKWYHIVATYSSSNYKVTIYINGAKDIEADFPFDIYSQPSYPVLIGGKGYTGDGPVFMSGIIDEVKIYNRTLSAEEVLAEYLSTPLATQKVILSSGSSSTFTFTWNTSGFAKGNYTIWAYAWPVLGETDTADNNYTDGWVFVAIVGDVNADGIVDIEDIYLISLAYGSVRTNWWYWHPIPCGTCPHSPNLDINGDGIIDIEDIYIASLHYGEKDP